MCLNKILGSRKLISVVKANAYGHGAVQVAKRLEADGCTSFAVATIDEAIALRENGIFSETVILGYTPPSFLSELIAYNLTQVVFDGDYAKELNREAENRNRAMSAYLKIDCGMGRLGIPLRSENLLETLSGVKLMRGISVKGIFSHPPSAEDECVTSVQTDALIEKIGEIGLPIYAMNGFGAARYPKYRLSGVRAGLSLYGYVDGFSPAMKLKARVVSVKRIEVGDSVGYGGTFTAEKPTDVAVVSAGYADGYPRAMSNVGRAEINGKAARVIGSVTMDMTMLNVTNLDVSVGDTVTLLGGVMSDGFSDCAEYCGTIVYEVLTGVAERVCRIYI